MTQFLVRMTYFWVTSGFGAGTDGNIQTQMNLAP